MSSSSSSSPASDVDSMIPFLLPDVFLLILAHLEGGGAADPFAGMLAARVADAMRRVNLGGDDGRSSGPSPQQQLHGTPGSGGRRSHHAMTTVLPEGESAVHPRPNPFMVAFAEIASVNMSRFLDGGDGVGPASPSAQRNRAAVARAQMESQQQQHDLLVQSQQDQGAAFVELLLSQGAPQNQAGGNAGDKDGDDGDGDQGRGTAKGTKKAVGKKPAGKRAKQGGGGNKDEEDDNAAATATQLDRERDGKTIHEILREMAIICFAAAAGVFETWYELDAVPAQLLVISMQSRLPRVAQLIQETKVAVKAVGSAFDQLRADGAAEAGGGGELTKELLALFPNVGAAAETTWALFSDLLVTASGADAFSCGAIPAMATRTHMDAFLLEHQQQTQQQTQQQGGAVPLVRVVSAARAFLDSYRRLALAWARVAHATAVDCQARIARAAALLQSPPAAAEQPAAKGKRAPTKKQQQQAADEAEERAAAAESSARANAKIFADGLLAPTLYGLAGPPQQHQQQQQLQPAREAGKRRPRSAGRVETAPPTPAPAAFAGATPLRPPPRQLGLVPHAEESFNDDHARAARERGQMSPSLLMEAMNVTVRPTAAAAAAHPPPLPVGAAAVKSKGKAGAVAPGGADASLNVSDIAKGNDDGDDDAAKGDAAAGATTVRSYAVRRGQQAFTLTRVGGVASLLTPSGGDKKTGKK